MFQYDNPVMQAINKITDLVLLSLLYALLSATFLCAGPAAAGLYYAVSKSVRRDRGSAYREFFHSFRENFRVSWFVGIVFTLFFVALFLYDLPLIVALFVRGTAVSLVQSLLSLVKAFLVTAIAVYLFPLISRFDVTLKGALMTSLALAIQHLPATLVLVAIIFAAAALILIFPWAALVIPGFVCYLNTFLLDPIFRRLMSDTGSKGTGTDTWYLEG